MLTWLRSVFETEAAFLRRTEAEIELAKKVTGIALPGIQVQVEQSGKDIRKIVTSPVRDFYLGYIYGFSNVMQQVLTDREIQAVAFTAAAQILQSLLGSEVGYELSRSIWGNESRLFEQGVALGADDANKTLRRETAQLHLYQALLREPD